MKKVLLLLGTITLISISCNKNEHSKNVENFENTKVTNQSTYYTLSTNIITLDSLNQINLKDPSYVKLEGKIETIIRYAVADGGGAYKVFQLATKLPAILAAGPGYPAALAVLGGIGASVLEYIRHNYEFMPNPNGNHFSKFATIGSQQKSFTESIRIVNYNEVGSLHNMYLDSTINLLENQVIDTSINSIYYVLTNYVNAEFGINDISNFYSIDEMKYVRDLNLGAMNYNQIYESDINSNIPTHVAEYMRDFLYRIHTYKHIGGSAIEYSDLFIDDIQNQSSFSEFEKELILYTISTFKNSYMYWEGKI